MQGEGAFQPEATKRADGWVEEQKESETVLPSMPQTRRLPLAHLYGFTSGVSEPLCRDVPIPRCFCRMVNIFMYLFFAILLENNLSSLSYGL